MKPRPQRISGGNPYGAHVHPKFVGGGFLQRGEGHLPFAGAKLKNRDLMLDSCGKGSFPFGRYKAESYVPKKPKNSLNQKSVNKSHQPPQDPTDNLSSQLHNMYHQLRSIGETLQTLDYDMADGIHLQGFGVCLCQLAEKVKGLEGFEK